MPIDKDTGEITFPFSDQVEPVPTVFIRTPYNYDRDHASRQAGTLNLEPSLTQQQFKEESDINTIVRRFGLTGQMPESPRVPSYGDFTEVTDYHTALNAVREADEAFLRLPAQIRAEFDNDPQKLLEALEEPRNADRLRELGLLKQAPPEAVSPLPRSPSESGSDAQPQAAKQSGKKPADQSST